ncbi:MAG: ComEC/Rec2 family competence protein [Oscillospiraceae bacterium]|nr:ComEC/Rec2 family competence protein [Oscillospiraceae bacterium]
MDNFRASSLAHLLAVSGAHVGYIVLGMTYLLNKSKLSKKKTNITLIFILLLFMSVAGFTPSVVRACIMGAIIQLSHIFHRKSDVWTALAISLLIVLIQNPFNIYNLGLQLSYLGVVGIILFSKNIKKFLEKIKIHSKIANMLAVTFSAQILIMPVVAYNFNVISLTFFISNVIAVPLLAGIIIIRIHKYYSDCTATEPCRNYFAHHKSTFGRTNTNRNSGLEPSDVKYNDNNSKYFFNNCILHSSFYSKLSV